MNVKKYIDVSTHQGEIDWEKVKSAGIDGVMIRAGYGQGVVDKQFVRNISECNRLGIPCGVFWFGYARSVTMAKKEAEYCLAAIKDYKVELPVAYDYEYESVNYAKSLGITITKAMATAFVHAFCGAVEEAGYYAMNYAGRDFLRSYFDETTLCYDLWHPWYGNAAEPGVDCGIWQYTSTGSVDGIEGDVDLNYAYKDYAALIRRVGLNGLTAEERENEPEPEPATDHKTDYEGVSDYARKSWEKAVAKGILDGTNPNGSLLREQAAVVLDRLGLLE